MIGWTLKMTWCKIETFLFCLVKYNVFIIHNNSEVHLAFALSKKIYLAYEIFLTYCELNNMIRICTNENKSNLIIIKLEKIFILSKCESKCLNIYM